jgi:hypothetical protein
MPDCLLDTNVLIYLVNTGAPEHAAATANVAGILASGTRAVPVRENDEVLSISKEAAPGHPWLGRGRPNTIRRVRHLLTGRVSTQCTFNVRSPRPQFLAALRLGVKTQAIRVWATRPASWSKLRIS